jgi:hypothetical protein
MSNVCIYLFCLMLDLLCSIFQFIDSAWNTCFLCGDFLD